MGCSNDVPEDDPKDNPPQQNEDISNLKNHDTHIGVYYEEEYESFYDLGTDATIKLKIDEITSGKNYSYTYQWCSSDKKYVSRDYTIIQGATNDSITINHNDETYKYYFCLVTCTWDDYTEKYKSEPLQINHTMVREITKDNDFAKYLNENKVLDTKYTYLCIGNLEILEMASKAFTIEPGTVFKFKSGKKDNYPSDVPGSLSFRCALKAEGTAEKPIIFTSYRDDSVGTKVHGSDGTPEKGDWNTIGAGNTYSDNKNLNLSASLKYCEIRYGTIALSIDDNNVTVDNCTFSNNGNETGDSCAVYVGSLEAVLTNCTFIANDYPISCHSDYTVNTTNHFVVQGKENRMPYILITNNGSNQIKNEPIIYGVTEIPYLIKNKASSDTDNDYNIALKVRTHETLQVEENVTILFKPNTRLFVSETGTITAASNCTFDAFDKEKGWHGIYYEEEDKGYENDLNRDTTRVKNTVK